MEIALWLIVYEDKVTISHLMDGFLKHNDMSNKRCIMADKNFTERDVFTQKIPGAELMICLFYTLRTFRHGYQCCTKDCCLGNNK